MPSILYLNHRSTWEHIQTEILNHDPKTQMGIIMRVWVKDNDMEDLRTILVYAAVTLVVTNTRKIHEICLVYFIRWYRVKTNIKPKNWSVSRKV